MTESQQNVRIENPGGSIGKVGYAMQIALAKKNGKTANAQITKPLK